MTNWGKADNRGLWCNVNIDVAGFSLTRSERARGKVKKRITPTSLPRLPLTQVLLQILALAQIPLQRLLHRPRLAARDCDKRCPRNQCACRASASRRGGLMIHGPLTDYDFLDGATLASEKSMPVFLFT